MAHPKIYPGATQKRTSVRGAKQGRVSKLVLHSTETSAEWGCPGYNGNRNAPTLTIDPWNKIRWQHFDIGESAKALVDPSSTSVRENRDDVDQIEIIGYSDLKHVKKYGHNLRELPQDGIDFIAETIAWYHKHTDVPLRVPPTWPMYPASYGSAANQRRVGGVAARMTGPQYDKFTGVLGHLHVPGNLHGDPAIDIRAVMAAAARGTGRPPLSDPKLTLLEDIMSTPAERREFARELAAAIWAYQTTEYYDEDGKGPSERSMTHVVNRMHQWLGELARGSLITDRVDAAFWRPLWPDHDGELGSSIRNNLGLTAARTQQLAEDAGVDIDETELGKVVASELAATVRAAVLEAGAPEEIANRAADILAGRLTNEGER